MRISHPIGFQPAMSTTSKAIGRALERLSTGLRVNRPQDDVASFASAVRLDSETRGLRQLVKNVNQTESALLSIESVMNSQLSILQKMRELAVQASNGVLSSSSRLAINEELQALKQEADRLSREAEFAGQNFVNGSRDVLSFYTNSNFDSEIQIDLPNLSGVETVQKQVGTGFFDTNNTSVGSVSGFVSSVTQFVDFDEDGFEDIVQASGGAVSVLLGDGQGSYAEAKTIFENDGSYSISGIIADDFDGDGKIDFAFRSTSEDLVGMLINRGNFELEETAVVESPNAQLNAFYRLDFDGDGDLDLVSADSSGLFVSNATIYENDGSGGLTMKVNNALAESGGTFIIGDFNSDGFDDFFTGSPVSTSARVYFSNGDGTYSPGATFETGGASSVLSGDFNGDGITDLVTSGASVAGSPLTYQTLLGDGMGSFTEAGTFKMHAISQVLDLNGDGIDDLFTFSSSGFGGSAVRIIQSALGSGSGSFSVSGTVDTGLTVGDSFNLLGLEDTDGDGILDLIIANKASEQTLILSGIAKAQTAFGSLNLNSQEDAEEALYSIDYSIDELLKKQSLLSASRSQLDSLRSQKELQILAMEEAKENMVSADFALETADLVAAQILQQAQVAAFSQANLQLQLILNLFDDLR